MIRLSLEFYPDHIDDPEQRDFKRTRLREIADTVNILKEMTALTEDRMKGFELVSPDKFMDVQFLSGDQKRAVLKKWTSFVKNGFPEHLFTEAVYAHLNLHCGYIAHFNRLGFHGAYWPHARDLYRHAKEKGFVVRPIPVAFYNWKSFLRQFNIWGDYADINTAMMRVLRDELELLLKDLIAEAHAHFAADMEQSYQLFLLEKERMTDKIVSLREEADEIERNLLSLTDDAHRKAIEDHYSRLFADPFSVATQAASQMSLI